MSGGGGSLAVPHFTYLTPGMAFKLSTASSVLANATTSTPSLLRISTICFPTPLVPPATNTFLYSGFPVVGEREEIGRNSSKFQS